MASSARAVRKAILGLALLGTALFLLLELSARVYLFGIASLDPRKIDSVNDLGNTGFLEPSPHPQLGYQLRPNLDGTFKMVPFRTNSRGLRDREYGLEKPEGVFRAAVLGSSFTLPTGVEIERAFHSVLEGRLDRDLPPLRHQFINFSVGAYQPAQLLATLELKALDYQPDLVLFSVTEMAARLLPRRVIDPRTFYRPGPRRYPVFESFLLKLWKARRESVDPVRADPRRELVRRDPASETTSDSGRNVIEKLGEIHRRTGIPIVVVRLEFERRRASMLDAWVERETLAQGIHYVDTRAAFRGMNARDLRISEIDPHPNATAHRIFAEVLARFLESRHLVGS